MKVHMLGEPRCLTAARPPCFFADALGLDFLNSIATPVDTPVDWIDDGEGFVAWLEQAELVPAEVLETLRGAGHAGRTRQRRRPGAKPARMVQKLRPRSQGQAAGREGSARAGAAQSPARARRRFGQIVASHAGPGRRSAGIAGRRDGGDRRSRCFCRSAKRWRSSFARRTSRMSKHAKARPAR